MMKLQSPFLCSLLAGAALAGFAMRGTAGGEPDVESYLVAKGQLFIQTNDAPPVLETSAKPYRFFANVQATDSNRVLSAMLRKPNGSVVAFTNEPDTEFAIDAGYASKGALDGAYPAGNYVFTINTANTDTQTATNNLPADNYPNAPRIINWVALQSVTTNIAVQIEWEPFIGGTTNDFVQLYIEDAGGNEVFFSGEPGDANALDGTSPGVLVPAGTFSAGSNYTGILLFARLSPPNTSDIPQATGIAAHYKETSFTIRGGPPAPAGGRFRFAGASFTGSETISGGSVTVTVLREGGSAGSASVRLSTRNGTATAGTDYDVVSRVLNWADGEEGVGQEGDVTILFPEDTMLEGNETFFVTLSEPAGESDIGLPAEAMVTIIDDEIQERGVLQFSAPMFMATEGAGKITVTVTRTGGSSGIVSAFYTTLSDTAQADIDFTTASGNLVFSNGVTSRTIDIFINSDNLDETNEAFGILLGLPTGGAALGANTTASLVIKDDDSAGTISFSSSMYSVSESTNGSQAAVIIRRTGGFAEGVSVDLVITGGSAVLDEDFAHAGGDSVTLNFAAGQTAITNVFDIGHDTEPEGDETILLQLRYPGGGARLAGITNSTIKILDDEVVFQFSAGFYTNRENVAVAIVFVERTGPTTGSNSVTVGTGGGSAEPVADYVNTNIVLTFRPGQSRRPVGIRIVNDFQVEDDETIGLSLEDPTGSAQLGNRRNATLVIRSDDLAGQFQFSAATVRVVESRTNALVTVTRSKGQASNVTVRLRTADVASASAFDYQSIETNLVFGPRQSRATVSIPLFPDAIDETNEIFQVTLDNADSGATIGRSTATVMIIDNDSGGMISLDRAEYVVNEAIGSLGEPSNAVRVVVRRRGGLASNVVVRLRTTDGASNPAVSPDDYTAIDHYLVFEAGEIAKTNYVPIVNDDLPEGAVPETILLTLREFAGGAKPGISNATIRITDDESSVAFSTNMVMGTEGSTVTLTVLRAGALGTEATVGYRTVGGTATEGVDYTGTNGTLTFGRNVSSRTITVRLTADPNAETNESFTVSLENPSGVLLGSITNVNVAVKDAPDPNAIRADGPKYLTAKITGASGTSLNKTLSVTTEATDVLSVTYDGNLLRLVPISGSDIKTSLSGGINGTLRVINQLLQMSVFDISGPGVFAITPSMTSGVGVWTFTDASTDLPEGPTTIRENHAYLTTRAGSSGTITIDVLDLEARVVTGRFDFIAVDDTGDHTRSVRIKGSFRTNMLITDSGPG